MRPTRGTLLTALLVALAVGLLVVQATDRTPVAPGGVAPSTPAPYLTVGVTTPALARNAAHPWTGADLADVDAFERAADRHAGIVMWFGDFAGPTFQPSQARAIARRHAIPEVSWEPWDAQHPGVRQPRYRLRTITEGRHDAVIRRWARAIAAYGGPVRLRFAHEMNGAWYPWAERVNGNRPGDFVAAWRHVRAIFADEGATNVTWIWAPVAGPMPPRMFPGAGEVDVLGMSGFNGGTLLFKKRWRPFEEVFGKPLDLLHAFAPQLPVELAEIASTEAGGSKARWIDGMFASLRARPFVRGLVWFDVRKEADWRIESSRAAQQAFRAGAAASVAAPSTPASPSPVGAPSGSR